MPSSEHVYATLAVNRRYYKILPFVCFFLLLATNTAMVIYFGVVNKPIPIEGQPASQDSVVTTFGTRQTPTPVVKKTTPFEDQPAGQDPVVTTSGTTQTPTPVVCRCPDTWIKFKGSCYLFPNEPETFLEAEQFCQQYQSHLVKIDNSNENDFVTTHPSKLSGSDRWIGLSDVAIEGEWVWTDGTKPSFLDWRPEEPNGKKTENCAILYSTSPYKWNDVPCGKKFVPICERL